MGWDNLLLRYFSRKYRLVVPGAICQGELCLSHFILSQLKKKQPGLKFMNSQYVPDLSKKKSQSHEF